MKLFWQIWWKLYKVTDVSSNVEIGNGYEFDSKFIYPIEIVNDALVMFLDGTLIRKGVYYTALRDIKVVGFNQPLIISL